MVATRRGRPTTHEICDEQALGARRPTRSATLAEHEGSRRTDSKAVLLFSLQHHQDGKPRYVSHTMFSRFVRSCERG